MAAASAFAAGTLIASVVSAQTPSSPSFGSSSTDCKGVNACKGQNACKGRGWVQGISSLECRAEGGTPGGVSGS
jgi:hypothetical protein